MKTLNFKLEVFEGPLDLLLSLIEKNKIDICDIEISLLLDQYLEYLEQAKMMELDLAADFLEMASTLVYIKSRSLLPKDENEEEDPKLLLERQLAEYAQCKREAAYLAEHSVWGRVFFRESEPDGLPTVPKEYSVPQLRLVNAYGEVLRRLDGKKPLSPNSFTKLIGTRFVTVKSRIIAVLRVLIKKTSVPFRRIFEGAADRSEIVATFLAILELIRSGRVDVSDGESPDLTLVRGHKNFSEKKENGTE